MNQGHKGFLASDLATALNVPRTTVNDWLARYADYLDFELRGKRKMYSPKALAILRDIAALRDAGKAAFEIEAELAGRYGLHPEVAPETGVAENEPKIAPEPAAGQDAPARTQESHALAKIDAGELERLFARLEDQEKMRQRSARRFWKFFLLMTLFLILLLLMTLALVGGFALKKWEEQRAASSGELRNLHTQVDRAKGVIEELKSDFAAADSARNDSVAAVLKALRDGRSEEREQLSLAERRREEELRKIAVELDRSRQDHAANLAKLTAALERQRTDAEKTRHAMADELTSKHEAEIVALREEFARRQLELATRLEKEMTRKIENEKNNAIPAAPEKSGADNPAVPPADPAGAAEKEVKP
jgi:cell division protein FtsB